MTADPILRIEGVTVRYGDSDTLAVDNLTLTIETGERVALIGPSGAGKSTVLRLASGLTLPTQGSVSIFEIDSRGLSRRTHRASRSRIGIISQDFSLVGPLRVASNVAAGRLGCWSWPRALVMLLRPRPVEEISAALDKVGISNKIWERTDRLSGGQQQRTAIARILFQAPELLLADEPVSSLDPTRSDSVMATLTETPVSSQAKTVVASMHDAPLALRHCDRIVAMRSGRLQFDLPPSQVTNELLDELYELDEHRIV